MRLIVNFGNSDLKLFCKKLGAPYIFRQREKFFSSLSKLVEVIENQDVIFDSNGNVLSKTFIDINDNDEKTTYEIDRLEFPILQEEICRIEEFENSKINEVLCFITKQDKHIPTDTYLFKKILLGAYGKTVFPEISFKFATLKIDPSDYSQVLPLYSEFISKIDLSNTVISIAQGTPAMCLGLSQSCARIKPNISQYYASNNHNSEKVQIKKLEIFSYTEKQKLINQLADYLQIGDYSAAKNNIENNYLSTYPYILNILDYFIYRRNYKFEDALKSLNLLKEKTDYFDDIIQSIIRNLNCIIAANPEEFDYSNEMCPYLLFESLSNIKLSLIRKDYFYTMALTSAFLDVLGDFIIINTLKIDGLTYNKNYSSYKEVDLFVDKYFNIFPITNKYKDLKNKLRFVDGYPHLLLNRNSRKSLLSWVRDNLGVDCYVQKYLDVMDKYQGFESFKDLRNKLPIAHSVKGISLEAINNSLNNDIEIVIEELYDLVKDCFDTKEIFSPYYIDNDKFITRINEIIK